jgi:hypothetical protein
MKSTAATAAAGLMLLAACGVKNPPQPPLIRVADPTRDLVVHQDNRQAVLSWSYPASTTSGESLYDLESIEVWRSTLVEVEAPAPATTAQERNLNRQLLLSNGELIAALDREQLEIATRGSKLEWYDNLEVWRKEHPSEESQMIWYAVRSICCRGRESGLSNIARLLPRDPPPPPSDLEVTAEATGIRLTWVPHEERPVVVERSSDGELWRSVTGKPLATGEWFDRGAAQGGAWNYRLRSIIESGGAPRVIGEPGPAVGLFYSDIYPPPAPADLVCLPEGTRVRLRWRAVNRVDTFRIYRDTQGAAEEVLATDLDTAQFEDVAPPPGISVYRVTAVDPAGNEGEATSCSAARGSSP